MSENDSFAERAETSDHPMNFLLTEDFDVGLPKAGDIREGQVVAHLKNAIMIDIGAKSEGIITGREFDTMDDSTWELLAVGNQVAVCVVDLEDSNGNIILSYSKAAEESDWSLALELLESQEVYKGTVIDCNKGGLLVRLGQIRGFIPASLLASGRRTSNSHSSQEVRLRAYVGEDILSRVIEVDRSRNRLILSERAAMKEIRSAHRARLLEDLSEGQVSEGRVVNLTDFGAFIDIGGLEGLVHLSELSWKRVNHPSEVLEIGQSVEVYILNVDHERNRVALSLKRLEPDPWTVAADKYQNGDLVEATITKLTNYGAFARLNDDYQIEGLIHISELSDEHVERPGDVVGKGQIVATRIIRIDGEQRQLGLSLKQVASEQYIESDLSMAEVVDS